MPFSELVGLLHLLYDVIMTELTILERYRRGFVLIVRSK
jgi:hypothetical protein